MFRPVRTRKTFEAAVDQIVDAIELGELRVGDQLPSERALAETLNVSRPTLREAIKVLADSGVVEVVSGAAGGTFVRSDIVPRGVVQRHFGLRLTEISGVLEARRLLEPRIAQLAGMWATDEDFEAMAASIEAQRRSIDDEECFVQLDQRFHLAIARAVRNETVTLLMRSLLRRLAIARELALRAPSQPELAIELHEETLRAIMRRDPREIAVAIDRHLIYLERTWEAESGTRLRALPPDTASDTLPA